MAATTLSMDSENRQRCPVTAKLANPRFYLASLPRPGHGCSQGRTGTRLTAKLAHLGVAGGCGGGVDSIALSDWIQPAVSGNDIAMCFSIIYVCPGQHVSVAFGERYTTFLGLGATCWPKAMSTDVSVRVAK